MGFIFAFVVDCEIRHPRKFIYSGTSILRTTSGLHLSVRFVEVSVIGGSTVEEKKMVLLKYEGIMAKNGFKA